MISKNDLIKTLGQFNIHLDVESLKDVVELKVSTDGRKVEKNSLFIGLDGENFEGHQFYQQALANGAFFFVFKKAAKEKITHLGGTLFFVDDPLIFLTELGKVRLQRFKNSGGITTALTGSNGKTTTKEMLKHLLSFVTDAHVTSGNFNNHIGVPLTLCELEDHHQFLVAEIGTNHPGEIFYLADILKPDGGLIISIGQSHLEFFGDEWGVLKEKTELFRVIRSNKEKGHYFLLADADCPFMKTVLEQDITTLSAREEVSAHFHYQINYLDKKISFKGEESHIVNTELTGEHNFKNLAMAYLFAAHFFPEKKDLLKERASSFKTQKNRSSWIESRGKQIFLDAYNANPSSMKASIQGLVQELKVKKVALSDVLFVIGDMNELGDLAPIYHKETGKFIFDLGVLNIVFVGRYAQFYCEGYGDKALKAEKKEEVANLLAAHHLNDKKIVMIKASRGLQLEELIDSI
jgi:UDP-N-acetylmuramoyl-tripeptide--D-alanyl-D-alanine ligase